MASRGSSQESRELALEVESLRSQLAEAQEVIRAIQSGDVDAVVVSGPGGEQVYTLQGAEYAYRALVEAMNEGAATISSEGVVLYCNQTLANLVGIAEEKLVGTPVSNLICAASRDEFAALFSSALTGHSSKAELRLSGAENKRVPCYVSVRRIESAEPSAVCMVVTDLTEHKRRDEIIAAGELARSILASAAEAIAVCDHDGIVISANEALIGICGFNPLFQAFDTALPLRIKSRGAELFERFSVFTALEGNDLRAQEVVLSRIPGKTLTLLLSAARVAVPSGIAGCVLTMTDITERKRAEEALRESEEKFRIVQELSPDGFTILRPVRDEHGRVIDFTFVYENEAISRINGTDPKAVLGRRLLELFPGHRGSQFLTAYQQVAQTGKTCVFEGEYGSDSLPKPTWFRVAVVAMGGDVAILAQDITERKRAEEALRAERDFSAAVLETAAALVVVIDAEGRITRFNRACEAITGYTASEACGCLFFEFLPPEEIAGVRQVWDDLCAGKYPNQHENHWVAKDGSMRLISWWNTVLLDAEGRMQYVIGTGVDVTDHRKAEEALIRSEKLAALGRMAATIAHEVNNPLAAATNALFLASSDPNISAQCRSALDIADQELRRAAHITSRTLGFYRDQNNRGPVELPKIIDDLVSLYARKLQERNIKVLRRYRCASCPRACFIANAGELRQVISNLIANGIDAVHEKGALHIRLARLSGIGGKDGVIRLTIADTGTGIRPRHLRRIFEPFFTTKGAVGTGLGLWISHEIIRKHGGSIRVRSKEGKGTVCSVTLPAMAIDPEAAASSQAHAVGGCVALEWFEQKR